MALPANCGLHQIGNALKGLQSLGEHSTQLALELAERIELTRKAVCIREEYGVNRSGVGAVHSGSQAEIRLERSLWKTYGTDDCGMPFLDSCPRLISYAVALFNAREQANWGEVDLIGVSKDGLPVVIELKDEKGDNPLRMTIEGAAYCIAVMTAWNKGSFRDEWAKVTGERSLPDRLQSIQLIGLAPEAYWKRVIGTGDRRTEGQVFSDHWPAFDSLLSALSKHGIHVSYASFQVGDMGEILPAVSGVRPISIPRLNRLTVDQETVP